MRKWPEQYIKSTERKCWLSSPSTMNILNAVFKHKRLSNFFPDSKVEIQRIPPLDSRNNDNYYFIRIEFTEADEAEFIMRELL